MLTDVSRPSKLMHARPPPRSLISPYAPLGYHDWGEIRGLDPPRCNSQYRLPQHKSKRATGDATPAGRIAQNIPSSTLAPAGLLAYHSFLGRSLEWLRCGSLLSARTFRPRMAYVYLYKPPSLSLSHRDTVVRYTYTNVALLDSSVFLSNSSSSSSSSSLRLLIIVIAVVYSCSLPSAVRRSPYLRPLHDLSSVHDSHVPVSARSSRFPTFFAIALLTPPLTVSSAVQLACHFLSAHTYPVLSCLSATVAAVLLCPAVEVTFCCLLHVHIHWLSGARNIVFSSLFFRIASILVFVLSSLALFWHIAPQECSS
ncbi:hypothetical protein FKP32DRAFT_1589196 [Trametes sanguinea]|nr:hypothetical protein FKP32DRAFT_1589196 [Trametes sanguinea]